MRLSWVWCHVYFTNTIMRRIVYRMKVTAMIPDELINTVKEYTQNATITEAITIVLKDWIDIHNTKELNKKIAQNPVFVDNGQQIRETNWAI